MSTPIALGLSAKQEQFALGGKALAMVRIKREELLHGQ